MRNNVLIYDDEPIPLDQMSRLLERSGLAVLKARHLTDAAEALFSSRPPAVFIADLALDLWINASIYDEIRNRHHFESDTYGNTGTLALIHDVQEQLHDVRVVLMSGINTGETARRIGTFGYFVHPMNAEITGNLIEVCRLGPLRSDELDETQRLKEGAFNMENSWAIKPYIERFWVTHGKERR